MSLAKEPSSQDVDEVDLVRTSTKTHLRPPLETINSEDNDNTQDKDADNDEEVICPACGDVEDGTPMVACAVCDSW